MAPRRAPAALAAAALAAALAAAVALAAPAPATVPRFERVVVVVLENRERGELAGGAPRLARLARRYAELTGMTAVAHPSLPNYLALVSGSTQDIASDCTDCTVDAPHLGDVLERAGLGWKAYAEGLPRPGFTGARSGRYAKKHVPFLYFRDVLASPSRLRRVVPLAQLAEDLARRRLPAFSLVVPDLCHDMHDCPTAVGDAWTAALAQRLLRSPQLRRGVVFVTFDEGSSGAGGGGRVETLALGPLVRPGAVSDVPLDHYSLLATIETGLGVRPLLGRAAAARPIDGIWRRAGLRRRAARP